MAYPHPCAKGPRDITKLLCSYTVLYPLSQLLFDEHFIFLKHKKASLTSGDRKSCCKSRCDSCWVFVEVFMPPLRRKCFTVNLTLRLHFVNGKKIYHSCTSARQKKILTEWKTPHVSSTSLKSCLLIFLTLDVSNCASM